MLVEFSVGNFRSFRDKVTFSMVAAPLKAKDKTLDENNTFEPAGGPRLLTSSAVYGANASGKSNLVRAIDFMRDFVLNSSKGTQPTGSINVEPFRLGTTTATQPSSFEIVFISEGRRYRYGFETTTEQVEREWLFHVPRTREARLFERTKEQITLSETFKEGKEIVEGKLTRPNALFLSVVAQFNGAIAQNIVQWFRKLVIASGLQDMGMRLYTIHSFIDGTHRDGIRELIKKLDLGIEDVSVEKTVAPERMLPENMPDELRSALTALTNIPGQEYYTIHTVHTVSPEASPKTAQVVFDLDSQESEGTKKLFALAGPLISVLKAGRVLIMDEFDARLHPLITREIVGLFNSKTTNHNHAQLIFTTQDTNLLDNRFFRRDQIWFTEKDRFGATDLYSLAEFKIKVRNDASFERDYIRGRYGAIPFVGELQRFTEEG